MNTKWKIEHNNDTGYDDEGYLGCWESWTVTDGEKMFNCANESDAKWLCELLNISSQA